MSDYREQLDALKASVEPDWQPPSSGPTDWVQTAMWHTEHADNLLICNAALVTLAEELEADNERIGNAAQSLALSEHDLMGENARLRDLLRDVLQCVSECHDCIRVAGDQDLHARIERDITT